MATLKKWIADPLPKRERGSLHKLLHVPPDHKFLKRELVKASHSKNKTISAHATEALEWWNIRRKITA